MNKLTTEFPIQWYIVCEILFLLEHSILRFVYSVQMPKLTATIDPALRKLIVELHLKSNSYGKIAETLCKSKSTIQSVIKRWKESGSTVARRQSGRPISVTKRDENRLTRILKAKQEPRPKRFSNFTTPMHQESSPGELCTELWRD